MKTLLEAISNCTLCEDLPFEPRPVVTGSATSKIAIIGQAPGRVVHESGVPWDDKSGENLRNWMGIDKALFYDTTQITIVPMGFCYPGTGKTGDLPPSKICAPQWHQKLWNHMPNIQLTLLIGAYAQKYYLPRSKHKTLTNKVMHFEEFLPNYFVLPHPSPRNNIWQAKNKWFADAIVPALQERIDLLLRH